MLRLGAVFLLFLILSAVSIETVDADKRCVRIQRQGNIETYINSCNVCQIVTITRSRPGSQVPTGRQIHIQARSSFPGPFRGPGRSRITGVRACKGEPGGQKDLLEEFNKPNTAPKCVNMERSADKGVTLVNTCGECRAVAIERIIASNGQRARDYMVLAGRGRVPVASRGYSSVGILAEIPCPGK